MLAYIIKRLLLVPVTLFAIILVNFIVIQFAPGGPVEQTIAQIQGISVDATARITGGGSSDSWRQAQTKSFIVEGKYGLCLSRCKGT
ncbi:MAG: hypothetical protein CM15mP62_13970 [Rhodospirillaceae bacterium]|nr:MAG: hypothetical protein CM15mP62_13970 [Rhodospirillaceae bacterium]